MLAFHFNENNQDKGKAKVLWLHQRETACPQMIQDEK